MDSASIFESVLSAHMLKPPDELVKRLRRHGQEHVLCSWSELSDDQRRGLLAQIDRIDLELMRQLFAERGRTFKLPGAERIQPAPVVRVGAEEGPMRRLGEEALGRGEVAVILVAGGQGSRLGFEHPKGMFPIGPVSGKSLFQIHAEKTLALGRRHGRPIPFLVMTSPATNEEARAFFAKHQNFGLAEKQVHFFEQGTMPALDMETGKLLMERPGAVFTSPNGHGGTLTALRDSGLLARLKDQGVRRVFYFQVDNPLVKVADPVFLGHHQSAQAEVSSKVVAKEGPGDKLGNLVLVDGRCAMIEYSDLPSELASQRDDEGGLRIWAGSPAIHMFDLAFLERVTGRGEQMPYHVARKKVPYLDETGKRIEPGQENALKFEKFIFDVLPLAERWTVVETPRREEFVPLKNASGPDSPEDVRQAISELAASWLERAGARVPRNTRGGPTFPLEVSPLFALDGEELAGKLDRALRIDGPTYLAG
jgi:UDP-N-acetylglucosamine/UDP-N-acetylgalactosamine diphosphorylase